MKKTFFAWGAVALGLMTSCGPEKTTVAPETLNGTWNIVEIEETAVTADSLAPTPFIGFDLAEGRLYGNSGCNRMMGTFQLDSLEAAGLTFGPIASTRMACPDMTTERNVLAALGKATAFYAAEGSDPAQEPVKIALCDADGRQLLVLEKQPAPQGIAALDGKWLIKTVNGTAVTAPEGREAPFMGFEVAENRMYANAGCNSISGGFTTDPADAQSLTFTPAAATLMMCPDMETETAVLKALGEIVSFKVSADGQAALCNAEGAELIVLEKTAE